MGKIDIKKYFIIWIVFSTAIIIIFALTLFSVINPTKIFILFYFLYFFFSAWVPINNYYKEIIDLRVYSLAKYNRELKIEPTSISFQEDKLIAQTYHDDYINSLIENINWHKKISYFPILIIILTYIIILI